MKNPYVLACFLLCVAPLAVLGLTLQEDDLVFDDVGEEGTSTAATVISRRYDERKANWLEQKYPHEVKRHQFDEVNNVPHVVVPVGHVLKLRVHKEAFTGPEDYYEVRKRKTKLFFFHPLVIIFFRDLSASIRGKNFICIYIKGIGQWLIFVEENFNEGLFVVSVLKHLKRFILAFIGVHRDPF